VTFDDSAVDAIAAPGGVPWRGGAGRDRDAPSYRDGSGEYL
jgi:hypothetical protein